MGATKLVRVHAIACKGQDQAVGDGKKGKGSWASIYAQILKVRIVRRSILIPHQNELHYVTSYSKSVKMSREKEKKGRALRQKFVCPSSSSDICLFSF